jgi:cytochrome c oxidase subunit 4
MNDEFRQRMRVPFVTTGALLLGLAINVIIAAFFPFRGAWIVELLVVVAMVGTVLWISMEIREQPPLVKLFSAVGFVWMSILFGMTLLDYATR